MQTQDSYQYRVTTTVIVWVTENSLKQAGETCAQPCRLGRRKPIVGHPNRFRRHHLAAEYIRE